jgi:hypothetical protein
VQFNVNLLQAGQGSGLGLYIAKGIVEQHRGTLMAASEGMGHGTTFTVTLLIYHVPDSGCTAKQFSASSEAYTGQGGRGLFRERHNVNTSRRTASHTRCPRCFHEPQHADTLAAASRPCAEADNAGAFDRPKRTPCHRWEFQTMPWYRYICTPHPFLVLLLLLKSQQTDSLMTYSVLNSDPSQRSIHFS